MKLPNHVAIIMDGNGRWAKARGRLRTHGHLRGARVAKNIIQFAVEQGLKNLSLFAFSTENWLRPKQEVDFLMRLLARQILRESKTLMTNNVRFRVVGELDKLPNAVSHVVQETIDLTSQNTGMNLIFALSYGGRQEIVRAAQKLALKVAQGTLLPEDIDISTFSSALDSHFLPDPDLIIRTSGEQRISNFFLWQSAYAELVVLDKLWPDFTTDDFDATLALYTQRERRFGRIESSSPDIRAEL